MKNVQKYLITVAGITVIGGGALFLGGKALAEEVNTTYPLIVQNLAEKFGLNPDEVQTVFTETREERQEMRMDSLVEDGVITEDQEALIDARLEVFRSDVEALAAQSMTAEERHTAMQELRLELETWAEDNNIPTIALRMGGPLG